MAIIFKEEKLKTVRQIQHQDLFDISQFNQQNKKNYVSFASNTQKLQPLHSDFNKLMSDETSGPGIYYNDYFNQKVEKLELVSTIKQLSKKGEFFEEYFLSKKYLQNNKDKEQEKLGFEVKDIRFKKIPNQTPYPRNYFTDKNKYNDNNYLIRNKTV